MNEVLSKLTRSQALHVLMRMADKDPDMAKRIETEAKRVLMAVDIYETAAEAFDALDAIDVQNCWDRAGSHQDGYTSPDEAAGEIIEEALLPFVDQAKRYHDLGMLDQERDYCAGILLGLYRYEKESKSEFRNWSADIPTDSAGWILDTWRDRNPDQTTSDTMDTFIRERCPDWAKYMNGK